MAEKHTDGETRREGRARGREDEPLSIRQLEVFDALVTHGSFTAAAAHMGVSQPTVSGHMADLERRLGMRLVERVHKGVRVTPEGEKLLPPARAALRGERNVRVAATELHGLVTGSLPVGASTIPAVYLLPDRLAAFTAEHPEVHLRLLTGSSERTLDRLASGEVELAVVGTNPTRRGMRSTEFTADRLVLIFAPGHPFASRRGITRDDVLGETLVMRTSGSGTRAAMLEGLGLRQAPLDGVLEVDGTDGVKAMVRAGLGVSFISELAVREDLAHGFLCTADVHDFRVERSFYVVTRSEGTPGPAVRAFEEVLSRDCIGAGSSS